MLPRSMRLIIATALVLAPVAVPAHAQTSRAPAGYRTVATERIARGLEHLTLERSGPEVAINVAHIASRSGVELRTVSSFNRIAGNGPRLERTSSMCVRVECLVAINGDFFREEQPVGAVVAEGEMLRSPNPSHHQLMITRAGGVRAGTLSWSGRLVATDLSELTLDSVNRNRNANDLVLYTPAYGARTGTNDHGVEMVLRFVAPSTGRVPIGQTAVVRIVSYEHGAGDTKIPADGAVLSAHGSAARALGALWTRVSKGAAGREALLRIETTPRVRTVIGGTPLLLRDGVTWFGGRDDAFVRSRHPRTVVGWNRRGDIWLVTIDGRQAGHSVGATLAEAATFLRRLGATDAINLDGGGSSTFVVRGRVVNRPSDRAVAGAAGTVITRTVARGVHAFNVERPVANALVVVAKGAPVRPAGPPDLAGSLPKVQTLSQPVPSGDDPASNPDAALPAVVTAAIPPLPVDRGGAFAAAGLLNLLVASALVHTRNRRRLLMQR